MKTLPPSHLTRRGESWSRELEFLRESITQAPGNPQTWWWRMRAKVVNYLISRYGRDHSRTFEAPTAAMPTELRDVEIGTRKRVEPRKGKEFREKLDEIRSSNDGFRDTLPEEPPPCSAGIIGPLLLILMLYGVFLVFLGIAYGLEHSVATSDAINILFSGTFIIGIATWIAALRAR